MLRHAEMPKEPRRASTVMSGFIDGPSSTAPRVGFFLAPGTHAHMRGQGMPVAMSLVTGVARIWAFNAPLSCGVKGNPVDAGKNVDSDRLLSEADKVARIGKILLPDFVEGSAEAGERRIGGSCVGRVRFYEQINILVARGCAWNETA
jgi:hypothetical protein